MSALLGIAAVVALAASVYAVTSHRAGARVAVASPSPLPPPASWTLRVTQRALDAAERIEVAERLCLFGDAWSVAILDAALEEEHDARVREAIWQGLLRLRSEPFATS
jgi:hypothetical protein